MFKGRLTVTMVTMNVTTFLIGGWNSTADINAYGVISNYEYIIVRIEMKTSWAGLICAFIYGRQGLPNNEWS